MATLSAKRCNPVIAAFAKRLAGKKPKVIIVACMRKLLVMLQCHGPRCHRLAGQRRVTRQQMSIPLVRLDNGHSFVPTWHPPGRRAQGGQ